MANNLVNLIITARDQASNVFGRITAALGGLKRSGTDAGYFMGESFLGAILKANLLGQAIGAISGAVGRMRGKFEEAKKIQLDTVSAASTFSALTGESYKDSETFVVSFGAKLSKIAGDLPGATADYQRVANSIMDNVIPAFKDANGVLNKGEFEKGLTDITTKMTLLGIQSNTDAGAVGMFTARLLDGNIGSARQLLFADNNPAFLGVLEKEVNKRGKKLDDWKKFDNKQRLEIVRTVSSTFVKDEVINAAKNTVDGLISGIQSSLFDPTSGVFGLLRDLSKAQGQQNVMTAVADSINGLMAFFTAANNILQALGIPSIDPMLILFNGINLFTSWVKQTSDFVVKLTNITKGKTTKGLFGAAEINPSILAKTLPNQAAKSFPQVASILGQILNPDIIIKNLSNLATQGLQILMPLARRFLNPTVLLNNFQLLLNAISGWLNKLWASLALVTGQMLNAGGGAAGFAKMGAALGWFAGELLGKIARFIVNLPWLNIFKAIGNVSIAGLSFIVGGLVGLGASLLKTGEEITNKFRNQVFHALSMLWDVTIFSIEEGLNHIGESMSPLVAGFKNTGFNFQNSISSFLSGWGEVINYWIDTTKKSFSNIYSQTANFISNLITQIISASNNFFNGILQSINQMWSTLLQSIQNGINQTITGATQVITGPINAAGNAVWSGVTNVTNTLGSAAQGVGSFLFGGAMYQGHIPTAAAGLLGAFATESRNMPSGATPVIANSSEWILTPSQAQRLMQGSAQMGKGASSNINFAPVFNLSGVDNPQAIAQMVMQQLEDMFRGNTEGLLA